MHTSPSGKKYVGITSKDVKERWKQGSTYKGCTAFQNAINKYQWENFEHEILYSDLTEKEAKDLEIKLIAEMDLRNPNKGYNISPGGDAFFKGGHHTDEAKRKISNHNRGKGNPMYGKPRPIGGGKPSKEVINLCTLDVYESQHEAERCVGATLGALNDVISGHRISMLGDYWMDYDDIASLAANPFFPVNKRIRSNVSSGMGCWAGYGSSYYRVSIADSLAQGRVLQMEQ
jgi:group I intron endonuclease